MGHSNFSLYLKCIFVCVFLYDSPSLDYLRCAMLSGLHHTYFTLTVTSKNQSRTNGPINAHLTIAQVMPKYNHNNEKQEALL